MLWSIVFEIQGRSLRQCRAAPRPELLRYAFKFQRWLVDELQVVVVPKELAELFAQDASLKHSGARRHGCLARPSWTARAEVNAEFACKWLFEGVGGVVVFGMRLIRRLGSLRCAIYDPLEGLQISKMRLAQMGDSI